MFADLEQRILDRLAAKLGPDVTVGPQRELERMPELRQKAPAAWVIYDGMRPGQSNGDPRASVQQLVLDWYVVVAAKSARGNGGSNDARDQAGTLATQVV